MKELDRLVRNHGPGTVTNAPLAVLEKLQKHLATCRTAASHVQKIKNKFPGLSSASPTQASLPTSPTNSPASPTNSPTPQAP
jgi:hypothetical protein